MSDTTTAPPRPARPRWAQRFWSWMPTSIDKRIRVLAWLSFLTEVIIIGTGGAVRLTGSGLGCSEWPLCTPDSLVPIYADQGIHGLIEFGNRTMTGVVGIVAVAVLLFTLHAIGGRRAVTQALWFALAGIIAGVAAFAIASLVGLPGFVFFSAVLLVCVIFAAVQSVRSLPGRKDLPVLAWVVLIGVIAQALVGGITVLTGLNPFIVGFHYTASLLLVCVTATFLVRMNTVPGARASVVPRWFAVLTHVTGFALIMTILFGVLTTGSGPHSGDADVLRHGFDATVLAHVHSWPGYILAGLLAVLLVTSWALRLEPRRWLLVLTVVVLVQVGVGVWQARDALPPVLVGTHMVLASLAAAAYTVVVMHLKRPVATTA